MNTGWISVDEKLPPKTPMEEIERYPRAPKTILMFDDFTDNFGTRFIEYVTGWYTGQFLEEDDGCTWSVMDVTHWMPLPCPQKEN